MPWTDETGGVHPSVGDTVTPEGVEHLYTCPRCRAGERKPRTVDSAISATTGSAVALTRRDRIVIAAAYEVDAAACRHYRTRNPFLRFWFQALASFLDTRAQSIREGGHGS